MFNNIRERVRLKADFLRLLLGMEIDKARQSVLLEFVETYMALDKQEELDFRSRVTVKPEYQKVEKMITTYEQEGRAAGKQEALLLQLEAKFGELEEPIKQRIQCIESTEKLESLLVSVLDAKSLDQLDL